MRLLSRHNLCEFCRTPGTILHNYPEWLLNEWGVFYSWLN